MTKSDLMLLRKELQESKHNKGKLLLKDLQESKCDKGGTILQEEIAEDKLLLLHEEL